jgi:hypothetical protein
MTDNGFVPLAPRRLQRTHDVTIPLVESAVDQRDACPNEPEVECAPVLAESSERTGSETGGPDVLLHSREPGEVQICAETDTARIRAAAIELAATACARALRYAVDRNPRLVARFVDDALRAAGGPHNAVIRVAPAVAAVGAESQEHDFVADPSLAPGDVFIDSAAGTVGATVEERAALLVRGAAS